MYAWVKPPWSSVIQRLPRNRRNHSPKIKHAANMPRSCREYSAGAAKLRHIPLIHAATCRWRGILPAWRGMPSPIELEGNSDLHPQMRAKIV